ncbi:hypothetical protein SAMN00120144_3877 [Hymenobacter roseosalivarius DSM 11622]|uniref:YgjP-like metallopeptidase domain-containing protein n=1 Tax=Hymenobacter roseosalivarius DSM 11622 TaxID=645990 RepID=A0A1W1UGS1_9BACT|nr:M48 family metallopeptidase [Hymenobacter roseosalivarius]SMB80011.1 hypothetical protein SAMN00120144_3877 [Hymenobacter roseosalivarius DSM 11622]
MLEGLACKSARLEEEPHLVEYVVVHELIHLLERKHNERFRALLDQFMPNWRVYREELNGGELAAYESFDLG